MITEKQEEILRHMLGADSRYKKKEWGFRNHFCSCGQGEDHEELLKMKEMGLVKSNNQKSPIFWATKEGALAIGFKPYQMRNTDF